MLHVSGVGVEARGGPHRHRARKERRTQSLEAGAAGRSRCLYWGSSTAQQWKARRQGGRAQPRHASDTHTHTRGDSFTKGLTNAREGQGGWDCGERAAGGAEAKVEGVTWPLLLHASSGHRPGSTVLQLVSACPRLPLLRPLSQRGRQTPSLPVCPAASLKTNGRRRQNKNPKIKKDKTPPRSRTQVRWRRSRRSSRGSPLEVPQNWGVGWEVEPQSGVGWGQWSSDPGGQPGLPHRPPATGEGNNPEGPSLACPRPPPPHPWDWQSPDALSWDIPHTCSAETRSQ